jgi:hypothetical protein
MNLFNNLEIFNLDVLDNLNTDQLKALSRVLDGESTNEDHETLREVK